MNAIDFFKEEDPENNDNYSKEVDNWLYDKNDMVLFAERYHQAKLKVLGISVVGPHFLAFAEWAASNYIRLHGTWVHKFADQRKKENYINTEQLWEKYNIIFPNEG